MRWRVSSDGGYPISHFTLAYQAAQPSSAQGLSAAAATHHHHHSPVHISPAAVSVTTRNGGMTSPLCRQKRVRNATRSPVDRLLRPPRTNKLTLAIAASYSMQTAAAAVHVGGILMHQFIDCQFFVVRHVFALEYSYSFWFAFAFAASLQ